MNPENRQLTCAGVRFFGEYVSHSQSKRSSGTATRASDGSIEENKESKQNKEHSIMGDTTYL